MKVIGITGGTGAGKTTALKVLGEMGAEIIDCDALYYQLLSENQEMLESIEGRFPGVVCDGQLQRKKLGAQIFTDPSAREDLNRITHRYMTDAMDKIVKRAKAEGKKLAAVDAIALIESGYGKKCDLVYGVVAPEALRAARIMHRDAIGMEYALNRIRAQQSEAFYREHCDRILVNDFAGEEEFADYCRKVFSELEEEA